MKKIKNIFLPLFFFLVLTGVSTVNVNAVADTFYTGYKCVYKHDNNKQVIIERKYTGGGIINTVTQFDKNGNLDKTMDRTIASTTFYSPYNFTTECPKSVDIKGGGWFSDDQIYPFDYDTDFKLKSAEPTGENIYNKLPGCEYQTNVSELKGDERRLIQTPVFTNAKTHLNSVDVMILTFSVSTEKTVLKDGSFVWEKQSEIPSLSSANKYTKTCPEYAHYNPPGSIHEYALTDSMNKPKDWTDDYVMERYADFSSQEAEMDKIYSEFETANTALDVQSCFSGSIADNFTCSIDCGNVTLKSECMDQAKIKAYSDKLIANPKDSLAKLEAIKLNENYTVKDLASLNSNIYTKIKAKYGEVLNAINATDLTKKSELIDCAYKKLSEQAGLSAAERQEIEDERASTESERTVFIKELTRLEANFNPDIADYDCSVLLDAEILDWISTAFLMIQIGATVFVILSGMLDFSKAAASAEADSMKKAGQKFIKRVMALMILLLLPFIIQFLLSLVEIPGLTNTDPLCR